LNLADYIVVNSLLEADTLSDVFMINSAKFYVVYNGIEDIFFNDVDPLIFKTKYNVPDKYIINIGNIEPRKNQLLFLSALKKFPDLNMISIGHIRDQNYFQECQHEGGKKFMLIDPLEYASELLVSALKGALFFAMPSTIETPSIAALEAAAVGKKVLITNEGSTTEYFQSLVQYIDPISAISMENAIEKILKQKDTSDLKQFMYNNYRWSHVVQALHDLYRNILTKQDVI